MIQAINGTQAPTTATIMMLHEEEKTLDYVEHFNVVITICAYSNIG